MQKSDGLAVEGLKIIYRDARGADFCALDIPALAFPAGKLSVIGGPSGCGKSTLLYGLSGLASPQSGEVWWQGGDILALSPSRRDTWRRLNAGFVFQDFQLVRELSARENVLLPARFDHFRVPAAMVARCAALLAQFGVPERGKVGDLSRGEAQRVALARALLRDPSVILADEPTASLDTASAAKVIDALRDLAQRQGKTVVCVTHDPALAEAGDLRIKLDHGRIAA